MIVSSTCLCEATTNVTEARSLPPLLEDSSYAENRYHVQACFNAVVAEAAGELPHRFSPKDLGALKERFRKTCIE